MKIAQLAPSVMCMDYSQMLSCLQTFEKQGIEYLHVDIMDGEFVPNFALGTDFCARLRSMTSIPLDIHLMISHPERKLDYFDIQPGEYVSVHWESTPHILKTLQTIRAKGAKAMVALNPGTPISMLDYVLDDLDGVLIMSVNPGFAGQKLITSSLEKIHAVRQFLNDHNRADVDIEVDGNVSFVNAVSMRKMGANIFVCGTSSVFSQEGSLAENIQKMRQLLP